MDLQREKEQKIENAVEEHEQGQDLLVEQYERGMDEDAHMQAQVTLEEADLADQAHVSKQAGVERQRLDNHIQDATEEHNQIVDEDEDKVLASENRMSSLTVSRATEEMRAEDLMEQIEAGETIVEFVQEERNDLQERLRVQKAHIEKARKAQDFIDAEVFSLEREVDKLQLSRQVEMTEMTDAGRADAESMNDQFLRLLYKERSKVQNLEEEAKNKDTTIAGLQLL